MKKVLYFLILCFAVMGCIGGIGYSVYCKAYQIAVGVVVLSWLAWPRFVDNFNKMFFS